ncbi:hypothetical protein [Rhodococcus koreensis]|uniref:hypothetical protein n=1 Tax=Rhodococcus koreensis TaxID=99653 RepID=UPI0036DEF7AE
MGRLSDRSDTERATAPSVRDIRTMEDAVNILDAVSVILAESDSSDRPAMVKTYADRLHSFVLSNPAASGTEFRSIACDEWVSELRNGLSDQ